MGICTWDTAVVGVGVLVHWRGEAQVAVVGDVSGLLALLAQVALSISPVGEYVYSVCICKHACMYVCMYVCMYS